MEKIILRKINGEVTEEPYQKEKTKKENYGTHLCWEFCSNACVSGCQKVADIKKKEIGEYDFIDKGFQVVNITNNEYGEEERTVDQFVVEECSHYEMDKPHDERKMRKLRSAKAAALKMQYFSALSLEEANQVMIENALRNINIKRKDNIANGRPEYEDVARFIPAGLKDYFKERFGIVSTSKYGAKK